MLRNSIRIGGLLIFLILYGCSSLGYQSPNYIKLAHKVTNNVSHVLKEENKIFLIGTGGQMMNDIQMMAMSFHYYHEVDLDSARKLIISIINKYLSFINGNQEIKPYLHEYPFTSKNVEIRIWIYYPDQSELPLEKIYCITSINGNLKYYIRLHPCEEICQETYEEAKSKIVHLDFVQF